MFQPTSSTARLIAAKQQKQAKNGPGPVGIYTRHRRPKSCKYDTYRLRSRTSVVEENLFGEPLKNRLMSRSRSMETISQGNSDGSENGFEIQQPTLFTKRTNPQQQHNARNKRRLERPRTALATMRPTGSKPEPEFVKSSGGQGEEQGVVRVVTRDLVRSLIVPQDKDTNQPLVLTRREFDRIRKAAQVVTSEDKENLRRQELEDREAALKAAEERKAEFQTASKFHLSVSTETELDKENRIRKHHVIEKAANLKLEESSEIKRLNEMIIQAKCHAIRDIQLEDRQQRLAQVSEADRAIEEQVEAERKQAEEMAAAQKAKIVDFNRDYREGLDKQRAEQDAKRILECERQQAELELRRKLEEENKEKDQKEAEIRKMKNLEIQQQMLLDVEESRLRKAQLAEEERLNDERIYSLQNARREAEIARENESKKQKKDREREMQRMKAAVEQEHELKLKREQLRLVRQQEAEERAWRTKEMDKAVAQKARDSKIMKIRDLQIQQRQEDAARAVERERRYWDDIQKTWHEAIQQEKEEDNLKRKVIYLLKRIMYPFTLRLNHQSRPNRAT